MLDGISSCARSIRRRTRAFAAAAHAIEPLEARRLLSSTFLKDINAAPTLFVNKAQYEITGSGGKFYFIADDGVHGFELWSSDGTAAGTAMVKDVNPGLPSAAYPFQSSGGLVNLNGKVLFAATDTVHGWEPWISDGTASGTKLVADVAPGIASSGITTLTALSNLGYFAGTDGSHGTQLWRTDGTAGGTFALSGPTGPIQLVSTDPSFATVPGANLLFFLTVDSNPYMLHLWRTDGTIAGTYSLSSSTSRPLNWSAWGARLAYTLSSGGPLWVSDGTVAGTTTIASGLTVYNQFSSGGTLYVDGNYTSGRGIYALTSPTSTPTLVASFSTGVFSFVGLPKPGTLVVTSRQLVSGSYDIFFYSIDLASGTVTSLLDAGTQATGQSLGRPVALPNQNELLLAVPLKTTGNEPWVTDGTRTGTHLLKDIYPGASSGFGPYGASSTAVPGIALFSGNDGVNGFSLWVTDGTTSGTQLLKQLDPVSDSDSTPTNFVPAGPKAYFGAFDTSSAYNLYSTDGTPAGTQFVESGFNGGAWLGGLSNGRLLLTASDVDHGTELWVSDGTPAGTVLLDDINGGAASSTFARIGSNGSKVFFVANGDLWASDGTPGNTVDLTTLPTFTSINGIAGSGGQYFINVVTSTTSTVYISDGTPDGTRALPGAAITRVYSGATAGSTTYFAALSSSSGSGYELFKYDPASDDLVPVKSGSTNTGTSTLWAAVGNLIFFATSSGGLWRSDGTSTGTYALPTPGLTIQSLGAVNGTAAFLAEDSTYTNYYLYTSDGTTTGKQLIRPLPMYFNLQSTAGPILSVGDRAFFAYDDGIHGAEFWVTDGTTAGTALYQDLAPGPTAQFYPETAAVWGSWLIGGADDGLHGKEPFVFGRTPPKVVGTTVDDTSSAIRVQFTDNLGPTLSTSAIILKNLSTGATIDPANVSISFDDVRDTAALTFAGLAGGTLPDGRYSLTLKGSAIPDLLGVKLDGSGTGTAGTDYTFNFEHLTADANHDGYVDAADQAILTANMGQNGVGFSQGDFNGDGVVDAADQAILTAAWHKYLPATAALNLSMAAGGDTATLSVEPGLVDVLSAASSPSTPLYRIPSAALSSISFTGGPGNDTLVIDLTGGNPIPSGGATFDGGAGNNTIRFAGSSGDDAVTASATSAAVGGKTVQLTNVSAIQLPGGSGGNDALSLNGGTYTVSADTPTGTPNVTVNVASGGTATFTTPQHLAALNINGGVVHVVTASRQTISANTVSITSGGTLDLGGNNLVVNRGTLPLTDPNSVLQTLYRQIVSGYNSPNPGIALGDWKGAGITSALAKADIALPPGSRAGLAIGIWDSTDAQIKTGQPANTVMVAPTVLGDANGDLFTDNADFAIWRNSFGSGDHWSQGDFNYDQFTDNADFAIWRNNFGNFPTFGPAAMTANAAAAPAAAPATSLAPPSATPALFSTTPIVPTPLAPAIRHAHHAAPQLHRRSASRPHTSRRGMHAVG